MDDLSRWLTRHGAGPGELTPAVVSEVLAARRAGGHHLVSARGAGPLLGHLRGLGVVPGAARPAARTPRERLMEEYRSYLASERGLAEGTTGLHLRAAAMFLAGIPDPLSEGLRDLSAGQVTGIVSRGVRECAVSTARGRASCVRVLLRFLFVTGQVPRDLAPAVPSAAGWRLASLPRRLDTASVAAVLGGCDRASEAGRREYAIVVVLARLGLRAGEVAALRLEDIDWRSGEVTVAGKGGRRDKLPLLGDVGQALATYLRQGRPRCASRAVFVTLYARRASAAAAKSPGGQPGNHSRSRAAGSHPKHRLFGQATPGPATHPTTPAAAPFPAPLPSRASGRPGQGPRAARPRSGAPRRP